MIKKSFFALLTALFLLSNAICVHAQTIYLFLGGDTNDQNIGESVKNNLGSFGFLLRGYLPENRVVVYNDSSVWKGPEIFESGNVKKNILTAIQKCPAKPSDKIVFYWSGYGDFDQNGHYINLSNNSNQSRVMYRSEILNALKAKGASLTVLITDACSSYRKLPMDLAMSCPAYDGIPPIISSLFLKCNGVVNINSTHPGESSYCGMAMSSVFTHCFVSRVFQDIGKYKNWDSFLKDVQKEIRNFGVYYPDYNNRFNQRIYIGGSLPASKGAMVPEYGDRIVSVNGIKIRDMAHFSQVIRNADTSIEFTLIDRRTGKAMNLTTDLNPKGSYTRLGITVVDTNRDGVMVVDVDAGSPGSRCHYVENGNENISGNDDDDEEEGADDEESEDEDGFDDDASIMCPENGDRILSVNGIKIKNMAHFSQIIRSADTRITFKLLDRRTGRIMNMMTDLNPKGSYTRLGITVVDDNRGGVRVIGVDAGSPGSRCRYLMYDD